VRNALRQPERMIDALLPDGLSPVLALALIAVSFVASLISAAFGLGGGILMLAAMAMVLPPAALIPVHGAVQIGSNAGRTLMMLPHVVRWALLPFAAGSLVGAVAGGAIAVALPPEAVQIGVGLFILWSLYGWMPPLGRATLPGGGAIAAFLTMFFGATGPFVASLVKSLNVERMAYVATHATFMSLQHILKVAVFGALGFAFGPYLPLILALVAAGLAGTLIGRAILMRINERIFTFVLMGILTVIALHLVWRGATALLEGG
jgi:uncharacterized protein